MVSKESLMDIVSKIVELQNKRSWTDYNLALQAGVTQSTIASMKNRNSPPKFDTLQKICNAFGISLSQFFLEDEKIEVVNEQEKNLLEKFRKLPKDKQNSLIDLL